MLRELRITGERWPLATPFRISRGVRTESELVYIELSQDGKTGRGEGAPIARYGDTAADCIAQLEALRTDIEAGMSRQALMRALKPGAARNALDCAMWDLEARLQGTTVARLMGVASPRPNTTAMTVSLGDPQAMGEAAAKLAHLPLVKVKVNADDPAAQLRAVRAAAPNPVLIVDCNEGWTMGLVREMQPILLETDVALLEQPLPASEDEALRGFMPDVPICADESCHVADDIGRLDGLYQAINIKLDKTGGLTAALDLLAAARERRLTVMTGCMICTSLSIAPTFFIAARADFADLDGPTWLARDRDGGVRLDRGQMLPPSGDLWGG
jgi:L-alanine-DL-glutamate epimerase-like enolase superfamily enzyme